MKIIQNLNILFLPTVVTIFYILLFGQVTSEQSISTSDGPIVKLPIGKLLGKVQNGMTQFLGVPFAEKPIGQLRFTLPKSPVKWNVTLNATNLPNVCHQLTVRDAIDLGPLRQDEDCLYLNIYIDGEISRDRNSTKSLPVIIWIHGGGFVAGSASMYHFDNYVKGQGVIVVTFQYRLGVFGFTESLDDQIPGNLGLHDQAAAIKWVKSYIGYFGGDGDSITLQGHSAGAISVIYHLLSPVSNDLFTKAIIQSGGPTTNPLIEQSEVAKMVQELANITKCPPNQLNVCLKSLPFQQLKTAQDQMKLPKLYLFQPTDERGFFTGGNPIDLIAQGKGFSSRLTNLLIGHTGNEGADFLSLFSKDLFPLKGWPSVEKVNKSMVVEVIKRLPRRIAQETMALVPELFSSERELDTVYMDNKLGELVTGASMACPKLRLIQSYLGCNGNASAFFYQFLHRPIRDRIMPYIKGALHGEELPFVFGYPINDANYTKEEASLSSYITQNWIHFAKYGQVHSQEWQAISADNDTGSLSLNYISFETSDIKSHSGFTSNCGNKN